MDIASISSAIVLNIGTLNSRTIPAMIAAGMVANQKNIPVVFDPVGVGASKLRNETAKHMIEQIEFAVIRGNISEIRFLAGLKSATKGVDASEDDLSSISDAEQIAKTLACRLKCIVAITGAVDIISDGNKTVTIKNGVPMLGNLTGTGCMCSSLIGCYVGANPDKIFNSTVSALLSMGIAGEIAYEKAGHLGNGSFHSALHDAMSNMNVETIERFAKYNEN